MAKEMRGDERKEDSIGNGGVSRQESSEEEDANSHAKRWDHMFARLLEFKTKHGKHARLGSSFTDMVSDRIARPLASSLDL